jgi:hypothetical protein
LQFSGAAIAQHDEPRLRKTIASTASSKSWRHWVSWAEPAVYADDIADEVREQLLAVDGVLVWVDPIHQGQTRTALDAVLRDIASRGPRVSAHPDVILKMGVKEVLYRTRGTRGTRRRASTGGARTCRAFDDHRRLGPPPQLCHCDDTRE